MKSAAGVLCLAAVAVVTLASPSASAGPRGPSATQYMAQRNIATACLKLAVPEAGPATISESSGDPGLDRVVLGKANMGSKRRQQPTTPGAIRILPLSYDMSDVLPSGRRLCVRGEAAGESGRVR